MRPHPPFLIVLTLLVHAASSLAGDPHVTLSNTRIAEDSDNREVGTLSVTPNPNNAAYEFTLERGEGDDDNSRFEIRENKLSVLPHLAPDYERRSTYKVRIRATDSADADSSVETAISIEVVTEESILSARNEVVRKWIKSNYSQAQSTVLPSTYWTDEILGKTTGVFNIYFAMDIQAQADVVTKQLRNAYEDSETNDEAIRNIRFLLRRIDSKEQVQGRAQATSILYAALESKTDEEVEAFLGWDRLVLAWHNRVNKDDELRPRYRESLFELYSVVIPALVDAIVTTHNQAGDGPASPKKSDGDTSAKDERDTREETKPRPEEGATDEPVTTNYWAIALSGLAFVAALLMVRVYWHRHGLGKRQVLSAAEGENADTFHNEQARSSLGSEPTINIARGGNQETQAPDATHSSSVERPDVDADIVVQLSPEAVGERDDGIIEPAGNTQAAFDVFLSHNSKDKAAVRLLGEALKRRGLSVWLDEWNLVPGRPWQEALEEIVKTVGAAAVLVGGDGMGPWQDREMRGCLTEFVNRELPVIPVLLPDAPTKPELPIFLKQFTWVDLRKGMSTDGLDRLEWGITGVRPSAEDPSR